MSTALKGSLIIGQSGGPSSVINSSAYGVIRTALDSDCITKVYGAYHGIKGVLDDQLLCMDEEDRAELDRLPYTPSSALGSCRYKIADPDVDDTDYKRILEIFKKYDVRYFCYNGGNESMRAAPFRLILPGRPGSGGDTAFPSPGGAFPCACGAGACGGFAAAQAESGMPQSRPESERQSISTSFAGYRP